MYVDVGDQKKFVRQVRSHDAFNQILSEATPEHSSYDLAKPQVWFDHMLETLNKLDVPAEVRSALTSGWAWYYPPQGIAGHIYGTPLHMMQAINQLIEEGRLYIREK